MLDHPKLGRLLFFDPTDPYVPVGYLPDHEQGSLALVGAGDAGDLVRVPAGAPDAGSHVREVTAELDPNGALSGSFSDHRTGESFAESIAIYRAQSKPDYTKMIERWMGRSIQGASATGIEVSDSAAELLLKGQFASAQYAQRPQPRMLIFHAPALLHGDVRLNQKTRKQPIVLDADSLSEIVHVKLPAEYRIDELPSPVKIDSPFNTFEASWTVEAGSILFKRKLQVPAQIVPAAQYAELRKFLDWVGGAPGTPIVLIR